MTPPESCPWAPDHVLILVGYRRWWWPWRRRFERRCTRCSLVVPA